MPAKKKTEEAATLERFERALRNALSTPPDKPRAAQTKKAAKKKTNRKAKRKSAR